MKPQTIGVVGPCGAGKSSIVRAFANFSGVFTLEEPSATTDSCFESYDQLDMVAIQREFILAPTKQDVPPGTHTVVRDRIESEHIEVFIAMHETLGGLSISQASDLICLAEEVKQQIDPPSAYLVATAPKEVLLARISQSRPTWLVRSFDIQLHLYKAMIGRLSGPALFVDTSITCKEWLPQVAEWVLQTLSDVSQAKSLPSNHALGIQWTILPGCS